MKLELAGQLLFKNVCTEFHKNLAKGFAAERRYTRMDGSSHWASSFILVKKAQNNNND